MIVNILFYGGFCVALVFENRCVLLLNDYVWVYVFEKVNSNEVFGKECCGVVSVD